MSPPLWMLALLLAQRPGPPTTTPPTPPAPAANPPEEQNPPEEDERLRPTEYTFNPLKAAKEIRVGDFYMKRRSYKAAVFRYTEATKWNAQSAEAFRKLGEAQEKQEDSKAAREAYTKALELDSDGKDAADLRKRIEKLK